MGMSDERSEFGFWVNGPPFMLPRRTVTLVAVNAEDGIQVVYEKDGEPFRCDSPDYPKPDVVIE